MSLFFVNNGAAGANNGTSWADAWTSLTLADGAATVAGDEVRVHKTHVENYTAITTISFSGGTVSNPVKIICVDKDASDALATGVILNHSTAGSLTFTGNIFVDGLTLTCAVNNPLTLANGVAQLQTYTNCTFIHTGNGASADFAFGAASRSLIRLINCTLNFSGAGHVGSSITLNTVGSSLQMRGGSIICRSAGPQTVIVDNTGAYGSEAIFDGVAITNTVTSLANSVTGGRVHFKRCSLPAFTNLLSITPTDPESNNLALIESCVSGTITLPPLGLQWKHDRAGQIKSILSKYRTDGADDGSQPHSWELISSAGVLDGFIPLELPLLGRSVSAGDGQTVSIYLASGITLQDDEFWVEIITPNEIDAPNSTSQGNFRTSRLPSRGTPADLATDGASTWNGSGVGTKQKVTFTINPAIPGPMVARCCLAKPSTTIYVDPKIKVA